MCNGGIACSAAEIAGVAGVGTADVDDTAPALHLHERDEPEDRLSRADIHALENRIVSLEVKIASLPTRRDLTRVAFLALLAGAALVLVGIEVLPPLLSKIWSHLRPKTRPDRDRQGLLPTNPGVRPFQAPQQAAAIRSPKPSRRVPKLRLILGFWPLITHPSSSRKLSSSCRSPMCGTRTRRSPRRETVWSRARRAPARAAGRACPPRHSRPLWR